MASEYLQANANQMNYLNQDNKEIKSDQSQNQVGANPFETPQAQLFATYFQNRHNPDGHLFTADQDGLSITQRMELSNYQARRTREQDMRNQGVNDADIALFRKWDEDIRQSNLSGQKLDFGKMLSPEYSASATQEFQYNESMYNTYVSNSRLFAKEEYDPDGDGHYNLTEDMLKEFKDYNDDDLANVYDNMSEDGKTFMSFDGIHDRNEFVKKTRGIISDYDKAHTGALYNIGQFFKGIGHGFISGLMDIVKLPTTLLSLGGALFTGSFDNPLSKAMASTNKWIDENTTGQYDEAVSFDKDSIGGKIGGFAGQAIEVAAEVALTGGAALLAKGVEKAGMKIGEKLIEKGSEKLGEKAVQKYSGKLIEKEAYKLAQKAGTKVTEDHIISAAIKIGGKLEGESAMKAFEHGVSVATVRLARRGAYEVSKDEIIKLGEKAASEGVVKAADKGILRVTQGAAEKEAEKVTEKVAEKTTEAAAAKQSNALIRGAQSIAKNISNKVSSKETQKLTTFGLNRTIRKGTSEHLISSMATKPTSLIGKAVRKMYGPTDPLTKLFAIKSFASSVERSQARGENPYTALLRSTLAFGTTNAIWGKLSPAAGKNPIVKMFERNTGKVAAESTEAVAADTVAAAGETATEGTIKKITNKLKDKMTSATSSKIKAAMIHSGAEVTTVAAKMFADGAIQEVIGNALTRGDDGKLHWNIAQSLKSQATLENISHTFLSAFTMELTGKAYAHTVGRGIQTVATPLVRAAQHDGLMREMDIRMSDKNNGIGAELWNSYKEQAKKIVGDKAKDTEIIDEALQTINAQSGALHFLVSENYVKANAMYFTGEYRKNLDDISEDIANTIKEVRYKIDKINDVMNVNTDHDMTGRLNFQLFIENAIMNNANFFDGQEIPEDLKHINNWQPEDMMIAYAFFKSKGIDLTRVDQNFDVYTPLKDSFRKATDLRKTLGDKYFRNLLSLDHNQIVKLANALNDKSLRNDAEKRYKFNIDVRNAATKENIVDRNKAILNVMSEWGYDVDGVKKDVATGDAISQEILPKVEDAVKAKEEWIKAKLSSGNKASIEEVASDMLSEEYDIEKEKYQDPIKAKEKADQLLKDNKINKDEYYQLIDAMWKEVSGDASAFKNQFDIQDGKYKDFRSISKLMAERTDARNAYDVFTDLESQAKLNPENANDYRAKVKNMKEIAEMIRKIKAEYKINEDVVDQYVKDIFGKDYNIIPSDIDKRSFNILERIETIAPEEMKTKKSMKDSEARHEEQMSEIRNLKNTIAYSVNSDIKKKIDNFENELKNIKEKQSESSAEVDRLKNEIDLRDNEINKLKEDIRSYDENKELVKQEIKNSHIEESKIEEPVIITEQEVKEEIKPLLDEVEKELPKQEVPKEPEKEVYFGLVSTRVKYDLMIEKQKQSIKEARDLYEKEENRKNLGNIERKEKILKKLLEDKRIAIKKEIENVFLDHALNGKYTDDDLEILFDVIKDDELESFKEVTDAFACQ